MSTADQVSSRDRSSVTIALVVAAALFMQLLDSAIINTSLPQMAATFGVSAVDMNAGVTAYILAAAIFTPLTGWLADRFGARIVFALAITIFTLASLGCAASTSLAAFIIARVAQGVGGALMAPVGRMIVLRSAKTAELMQVTALLAWPALFAPVIGPVLGGAITSFFGWRWNFLLNLPLGLVGVGLVLMIIPNFRAPMRKPLDVGGAMLAGASLFFLVYGLGQLGAGAAIALPLGWLAAGGLCGVAAIAWLRRRQHPLVDLAPIRIPTFAITSIGAGNLFAVAISGAPFLLPLMLQSVWGYDPLRTGWWLLVYFLGNLLMKTLTTRVLRTWGFRTVMLANGLGISLTLASCGLLGPATAPLVTALVLFAAGATRSMQFTAAATLAFADVPADQRNSAATLSSMTQQLAMAVGVTLAALMLNIAKLGRGSDVLAQSDFRIAFMICGFVAMAGTLLCLRLVPHAGAEVSGHTQRVNRRAPAITS